MLYLTRREGQALVIDGRIELRVVEVRGRTVKLGLRFPPDVTVVREEVWLEVQAENAAAALDEVGLPAGLAGGGPAR